MFSLLLHKDVFLPDDIKQKVIALEQKMHFYKISGHLYEHLNNQDTEDRSHTYFKNAVLNYLREMCSSSRPIVEPFQVEISKDFGYFGKKGWFVTKYCIRLPFRQNEDLVIVIRPKWDKRKSTYDLWNFLIVTAWINHKDDSHTTLDASKYCTEEDFISAKEYKSRMFR